MGSKGKFQGPSLLYHCATSELAFTALCSKLTQKENISLCYLESHQEASVTEGVGILAIVFQQNADSG